MGDAGDAAAAVPGASLAQATPQEAAAAAAASPQQQPPHHPSMHAAGAAVAGSVHLNSILHSIGTLSFTTDLATILKELVTRDEEVRREVAELQAARAADAAALAAAQAELKETRHTMAAVLNGESDAFAGMRTRLGRLEGSSAEQAERLGDIAQLLEADSAADDVISTLQLGGDATPGEDEAANQELAERVARQAGALTLRARSSMTTLFGAAYLPQVLAEWRDAARALREEREEGAAVVAGECRWVGAGAGAGCRSTP